MVSTLFEKLKKFKCEVIIATQPNTNRPDFVPLSLNVKDNEQVRYIDYINIL